jgi:hypothetical protein
MCSAAAENEKGCPVTAQALAEHLGLFRRSFLIALEVLANLDVRVFLYAALIFTDDPENRL